MSALAEALVAAQRRALSALEKQYAAVKLEADEFRDKLVAIGLTDDVDADHVRDRAGFDATRTLDAVAMDTWPSSGLALHGIEVKVSRADWLRELAHPEKAAAFVRFMDYFWVAAPRDVVRASELPEGWGLIEPRGSGLLVSSVQAKRLIPEPVDRSFMACLMRAACRNPRFGVTAR